MSQKRGLISKSLCLLVGVILLSQTVVAGPYESWTPGQEVDITGHSFAEEYWTADISNTTENGENVTFSISYVNAGNAEVFLMALKTITNQENGTGALPWQLFGWRICSG